MQFGLFFVVVVVVCTNTLLTTNLTTNHSPIVPALVLQDFVASLIYLKHIHYLEMQYWIADHCNRKVLRIHSFPFCCFPLGGGTNKFSLIVYIVAVTCNYLNIIII